MIKFVFLTAVVAAVQGNVAAFATARNFVGSYDLYTWDYEDGQRPFSMPSYRDLEAQDPLAEPPTTIAIPCLNPDRTIAVIVHGHNGDKLTTLNPTVKNAFLTASRETRDVCIIVVDWSGFTKHTYATAVTAVRNVGTELGDYIVLLAAQGRISLSQLHLVGFDLGAHVIGFIGRRVLERTEIQVPRITGLDPSGSQWGANTPRLSINDARYVEVIHTDGDGLLANGIGTPIGDVDFFVNGGSNQPGCLTHSCSHNRAWEVFADTLTRDTDLEGRPCRSSLVMSLNKCQGNAVPVGGSLLYKFHDHNVYGYRVNTRRTSPY